MRGSEIIQRFERGSLSFEHTLREVDREISAEKSARLSKEQRIAGLFSQIAALHLPIAADYDKRYAALLADRVIEEKKTNEALLEIEAKIEAQVAVVDTLSQNLEAAERRVEQALAVNDDYLSAMEEKRALEATLAAFERQAAELRAEYEGKLPAYEAHAVYRYLKARGYGTPAYRAGKLVRWLDGWAAGQCNFTENRRQQALLEQMGPAIDARAKRLQEDLDGMLRLINRISADAENALGLTKDDQALEAAQARLTELKGQARTLRAALKNFADEEDEIARSIKDGIRAAMKNESKVALRRRIKRSESKEDDALLDQIDAIEATLSQHEARIDALQAKRRVIKENRDRAKRIERKMRERFRSGSQYRVDRRLDLEGLITGYALGTLSESQVLNQAAREIRREDPPASSYGSSSSSSSSFGGSSSGFSSSDSFGGGGGSYSTSDSF